MAMSHLVLVLPGLSPLIGDLTCLPQQGKIFRKIFAGAKHGLSSYEGDELFFNLLTGSVPDPLPIASITATADGLGAGGCWMRADPVELSVDLMHVRMMGGHHLTLSSAENQAILNLVNPLLRKFNLNLIITPGGRGYVKCEKIPQICTTSPDKIMGRSIAEYCPEGEERGFWLRLMTEIQMLLAESEFNKIRQSHGLPCVNSLWFWGQGESKLEFITNKYQSVMGDNAVVKGLATRANLPYQEFKGPIEKSIETCLHKPGKHLWVSTQSLAQSCPTGALLDEASKLLLPVFNAIKAGGISSLELYPGGKGCYHVRLNKVESWWRTWGRK